MPYHGRYLRMEAGDPGLFSGISKLAGKVVGKVAPKLMGFIPGVGTALSIGSVIAGPALKYGSQALQKLGIGAKAAGTTAAVLGTGAAVAGGVGTFELAKAGVHAIGSAFGPHQRRRRRMNVANPRALRRGIRRLRGFEKLARKVMVVHSYKHLGHSRIGHARHRKAA